MKPGLHFTIVQVFNLVQILWRKNIADTGGKYGGSTGSTNTGRSAILFIGAGLENLDKINTSQTGYTGDKPSDVESSTGDHHCLL